MLLREPAKFDELGLGWFQGQTGLPQPLAQGVLDAKGILSILETYHKVVDVSAHVGLSPQPGFDHALVPEVEYIMRVHVAQHDADRTALWGSLLVWIDLAVFQDACLQPAPDQADHARIADAVLHEAEHPFGTETPEEILQVRLHHPAYLAAGDYLVEGCQGMVRSPFSPSPKSPRPKIPLAPVPQP